MKTLDILVSDIYARVSTPGEVNEDLLLAFGEAVKEKVRHALSDTYKPYLRLSNLGTPCRRKLWYTMNKPEYGEALRPEVRVKFLIGHIWEELILYLAQEAGHSVREKQAEVEIAGVKGHIDALVDDELVDVKSASTYSMSRFRDHNLERDDPFGYLGQLGAYGAALAKDRGSFIAVDKTLGHIVLDTYDLPEVDYEQKITTVKTDLAAETPPPRAYKALPYGSSGNERLGVECSYCDFKRKCWPGLRAFSYSKGLVYLSKVTREPEVPEL